MTVTDEQAKALRREAEWARDAGSAARVQGPAILALLDERDALRARVQAINSSMDHHAATAAEKLSAIRADLERVTEERDALREAMTEIAEKEPHWCEGWSMYFQNVNDIARAALADKEQSE